MVETNVFTHLKATGSQFTWCNKQVGANRVYSKIDWEFGNYWWLQRHGHIDSNYMIPKVSDHSPILINFQGSTPKALLPKPFKLYTIVMSHPEFKHKVRETWSTLVQGNPIKVLWGELRVVKVAINDLNIYYVSY